MTITRVGTMSRLPTNTTDETDSTSLRLAGYVRSLRILNVVLALMFCGFVVDTVRTLSRLDILQEQLAERRAALAEREREVNVLFHGVQSMRHDPINYERSTVEGLTPDGADRRVFHFDDESAIDSQTDAQNPR